MADLLNWLMVDFSARFERSAAARSIKVQLLQLMEQRAFSFDWSTGKPANWCSRNNQFSKDWSKAKGAKVGPNCLDKNWLGKAGLVKCVKLFAEKICLKYQNDATNVSNRYEIMKLLIDSERLCGRKTHVSGKWTTSQPDQRFWGRDQRRRRMSILGETSWRAMMETLFFFLIRLLPKTHDMSEPLDGLWLFIITDKWLRWPWWRGFDKRSGYLGLQLNIW